MDSLILMGYVSFARWVSLPSISNKERRTCMVISIYIYVNIQQYPSISQHQYRCLYSININMCTMFLYINMHFHFKVMSIYKYQHSPRRLWCAYELAAYSRAEEKPLQVMPVTRMHSFMVMSPPK